MMSPLLFRVQERGESHITKGNLCPAFNRKGGGVPVVSQLLSAQNNPYAKVACFGVLYSLPLQYTGKSMYGLLRQRALNSIFSSITY